MSGLPQRGTDRIIFSYHHEDGVWWAESDQVRWVGQCDTLQELRERTAEGIRFVATDGEAIAPPARSLLFVHLYPTPWVRSDPEATETFTLDSEESA